MTGREIGLVGAHQGRVSVDEGTKPAPVLDEGPSHLLCGGQPEGTIQHESGPIVLVLRLGEPRLEQPRLYLPCQRSALQPCHRPGQHCLGAPRVADAPASGRRHDAGLHHGVSAARASRGPGPAVARPTPAAPRHERRSLGRPTSPRSGPQTRAQGPPPADESRRRAGPLLRAVVPRPAAGSRSTRGRGLVGTPATRPGRVAGASPRSPRARGRSRPCASWTCSSPEAVRVRLGVAAGAAQIALKGLGVGQTCEAVVACRQGKAGAGASRERRDRLLEAAVRDVRRPDVRPRSSVTNPGVDRRAAAWTRGGGRHGSRPSIGRYDLRLPPGPVAADLHDSPAPGPSLGRVSGGFRCDSATFVLQVRLVRRVKARGRLKQCHGQPRRGLRSWRYHLLTSRGDDGSPTGLSHPGEIVPPLSSRDQISDCWRAVRRASAREWAPSLR